MHGNGEKGLAISFLVTLVILVAEVIGGIVSNSLALLSDAGHVVADAFAIALSIAAVRISKKPSDARATYGYHKTALLAALINGMSLLVIAGFIFVESYERFLAPPSINTPVMFGVAVGGFIGNIVMVLALKGHHEDLNVKSAWFHVLGDTFSSVGVIVSSIMIALTGWIYADPIMSVLISIVISVGGILVLKDVLRILFDLTPRGYDVERLSQKIAGIPGVIGIHDVHLWSVSHDNVAFSAHILMDDRALSEAEKVKKSIEYVLAEEKIAHTTLQMECTPCANGELYCRWNQTNKKNETNFSRRHVWERLLS